MSLRRLPLLGALALAGFLAFGCAGYRVGGVGGKNIQGVNTVYIPVIKNKTLEPTVEVPTTTAIVRAFDKDGTLATSQSNDGDSQLDVVIVDVRRSILTPEQLDGQAGNQFELTLVARVTFINRKLGKKILDNVLVQGSNSYFINRDQVEGERQALPMAEEALAKNIVGLVTEGW